MAEREPIQEVNVKLGDDMSKMFYEASILTYDNRPGYVFEGHGSFSGFKAIRGAVFTKHIERLLFGQGFDGIGTKVEIAERLNEHFGSAFNLLAMAADDVPVRGGEAISVGTVLDVSQFDEKSEAIKNGMRQLALGMVAAAKEARVVVINGEIAELGYRINGYGDFNYNWAAGVWWAAHEERILTGHQIKPGDSLIGLVEPGFRSNGITDVRMAMLEHYGDNWHRQVERSLGDVSLGKIVNRPSIIYSGFVTKLTGGFDIDKEPKAKITGVAHITGGGQPSKLGRMLEPSGLGATVDMPIDPPEAMLYVQRLRGFSDKVAYSKWHMGPGMIIATPEPEKVIHEGQVEGFDLKEIGEVTDEPGIRIKNRGAQQDQEWLVF